MGPPDKATEGYYSRKAWGQPRKDFSPPTPPYGCLGSSPACRADGWRAAGRLNFLAPEPPL